MPTANVYYGDGEIYSSLVPITHKLKEYLAGKLTCNEIILEENEISIRFVETNGEGMLGDVELEITAYEFPDRVKKQDAICHDIKQYIERECPAAGDVRVWLKLCKLGHDVL
jgi:hypothetical protein